MTISKETTYITEPLRKDGYPDYVASLNQRMSKGVTPENNAAVLFWKAMGPEAIKPEYRERYFQMLGIQPLPEKGDYFVTLDALITRMKNEKELPDKPSEDSAPDPIWEQFNWAGNRPWSKAEHPVLAKWVAVNEKPLDLLIEAAKRPRRYDPLFYAKDGSEFHIGLIPIGSYRDAARALCSRAMLRVHEGRTDEAWQDLLACHRLARLVGQGTTLAEGLVAITIDGITEYGDQTLLRHAKLTANQIARIREDIAALSAMPRMADAVDVGERIFVFNGPLAVVRKTAVSHDSLLAYLHSFNFWDYQPKAIDQIVNTIGNTEIDWNVALRMNNLWFDRFADACRKPTHGERSAALMALDRETKLIEKTVWDVDSLRKSMTGDARQAVSERVGQIFVTQFVSAIGVCSIAEDRATMLFELTKLAFALAAYRADHGSYPAKLADLLPKYVKEVPKDIFNNDGDLHYTLQGDSYLLYSVGDNGKDDGGKGFDDRRGKDWNSEEWDDLAVRMSAVKP